MLIGLLAAQRPRMFQVPTAGLATTIQTAAIITTTNSSEKNPAPDVNLSITSGREHNFEDGMEAKNDN
jgi:hypothetical protein